MTQVKGGLIMGLGPALWEEMKFENGHDAQRLVLGATESPGSPTSPNWTST